MPVQVRLPALLSDFLIHPECKNRQSQYLSIEAKRSQYFSIGAKRRLGPSKSPLMNKKKTWAEIGAVLVNHSRNKIKGKDRRAGLKNLLKFF